MSGRLPKQSPSAPSPRQPTSGGRRSTSPGPLPVDSSGAATGVPPVAVTPAQGGGATGQLTQGEIAGVVTANQPMMKRRCWQPALESRPMEGPANVRVMASLVIDPTGNVESVSVTGGERDFPGLSTASLVEFAAGGFPPQGRPRL